MSKLSSNGDNIEHAVLRLIHSQQGLMMATRMENGLPHASYAPFHLSGDGIFFVLLSKLSQHSDNLLKIGDCSVLIVDRESDQSSAFARERLMVECKAKPVELNTALYRQTIDAMRNNFGEILDTLTALPDFRLFALCPNQLNYIRGFGKAYKLAPSALKYTD